MKTGGPMKYGNITVNLNRVPVEVSILVEGRQQSGAFVANREQRGIRIADEQHQINMTADDALLLLEWLEEQAPALRTMLDEEAAALAAVDERGVD
jgi:hypothetical protein